MGNIFNKLFGKSKDDVIQTAKDTNVVSKVAGNESKQMTALKLHYKFTPERITSLAENEVFVFGSNLAGRHSGGAARVARNHFGAIMGQGIGMQGKSYAIPTMQGGVETIKPYVEDFIAFAKEHQELVFLVTRIGCGIAGFKDEEIAPLFADALNIENIVLPKSFVDYIENVIFPKVPRYMVTKVHGQTATLVDMIIELNKEQHFTSAEDALTCLGTYLKHLRTDGDEVAFNCSIRSLWSCCDDSFSNGHLDVDRLRKSLHHSPMTGIEKVYGEYVIEKTVKLIVMMNEFRRYTNPKDIAEDFHIVSGGVNHCGPQNCHYYFGFGSPGPNYIKYYLENYVHRFWSEFAPNGVLDNRLFRDFMIERHQRGVDKYGLDAVIKRNYSSGCHGFSPYRGGAGPFYMWDEENRRYIKSCGEGAGPNRDSTAFEYSRMERILNGDPKYVAIICADNCSCWDWCVDCYVPKTDYSLPVFNAYGWVKGKMEFKSFEEKVAFIKDKTKNTPSIFLDPHKSYVVYFDVNSEHSTPYRIHQENGQPLVYSDFGEEITFDTEDKKQDFLRGLKKGGFL